LAAKIAVSDILLETKVQRFIFALITVVVLSLAYASGALAADANLPPPLPSCTQMGKAPPDCSQMGKAPPTFIPGMGKAPPPMPTKSPLLITKARLHPLPPPPDWTGFYLGGDAGGGWLKNTAAWNPLPSPGMFGAFPITGSERSSGFIGGAYGGYNWQFGPQWVAGVEGDWSWTKAPGTISQPWAIEPGFGPGPGSLTTLSSNLDWIASARGRVGLLATPTLLAYATGGGAWARIGYDGTASNGATYAVNAAPSVIQSGYAVGGGLEWMMTGNWFVRAEYLYYRFAKGPSVLGSSAVFPAFPSNFVWSSTDLNVVRGGVSYRF
jgi:outer membrane immunogenic protein